jgi:Bacterial membrane protein YfhO
MSSSPTRLTPTPAVAALQKTVGSSLVGLGTESCIASTFLGGAGQGILAQANVLFDVHELAMYDPLAPSAYYSVWHSLTGKDGGSAYYYQFCPAVSSVNAARRFGVGYVLERPNTKGPSGSRFVKEVGGDDLYKIPGAAAATLVPSTAGGALPSNDKAGTPIAASHPDPATWKVATDSSTAQVLRLRITNVPGWHATIDGHPLSLMPFSDLMLQARVPAGRHSITVSYWPTSFTFGLVLSAVTVGGLAVAITLEALHRRRRGGGSMSDAEHPPGLRD